MISFACFVAGQQDKASNQNTSIQQRLKWAAGANPSLQKVLSSVEADVETRTHFTKKEATLRCVFLSMWKVSENNMFVL